MTLTQGAVPQWRDISTAPKDGTAILVFGRNEFSGAPYIGVREWNGIRWIEPNIAAHDLDDWLDGTDGGLSHWTTLPPPPEQP